MTRLLHADAILLGDGTAVRDGAIVVEGNVVRAVGPAAELLPRAAGAAVERLRGVLLPGLINAHTHLELSGMRGKTPPGAGFVPWLTALQQARAEELEEERDAAIDAAIAAMQEAGVVGVGEVSNTLVAWARLSRRFFGTLWHEVFALDRARGLEAVAALPAARDGRAPARPNVRWAPAPHALYSTHPDVIRALVELAGDAPLTVHLAEHAAERAFLRDRGGPLAAFYASRGLSDAARAFPVPGIDPIAAARALGLLRPGAALVHLADARPEELAAVAESGAIAVLCPRSNLTIDTRLPPLVSLRAAGVPIALGTDSLASSPSLDPLADARALFERNPEVPASFLVAAATSGGARAIGWPELGRIVAGAAPGVLHIEGALPADADPSTWVLRVRGAARRLIVPAGGDS
ncbi:MAG: amidohydrolase family protein [Deltaproteobacteria bacterium]|nr:amidohydrolase family protein [Deltaproteobacteria bacterium]